MQTILEVDYENVLVDTMLQHRQKHAPVSLYIDCERDEVAATKYLFRRLGIDIDVSSMTEAKKEEVERHALSIKDIHCTPMKFAAFSVEKLKAKHPRVAVYARVSMKDPHTAEFLKAVSIADHLVIVTV